MSGTDATAGNPQGKSNKAIVIDTTAPIVVGFGAVVDANGNRSPASYNIFADINGDGVVDINDVRIVQSRIGTSLP